MPVGKTNRTKLRLALTAHGMRQTALAVAVGLTPQTVSSAVKSGIKTTRLAKKYAAAIGCDWRELLD